MFTFSSSPSPFNGDSTVTRTAGSTSSSRFFNYPPSTSAGGSTVAGTSATASNSWLEATFGSNSAFHVAASSPSLFSDGVTVTRTSVKASNSVIGATFGSPSAFLVAASSPSLFPDGATVTITSVTASNSVFGATFGSTQGFTVAESSPTRFPGGSTIAGTSATTSNSLFGAPCGSTSAFPVAASSPSLFSGGTTVTGTSVTAANSLFGTTFGSTPGFTVAESSPTRFPDGSTIAGTSATASPSPLLGFSTFAGTSAKSSPWKFGAIYEPTPGSTDSSARSHTNSSEIFAITNVSSSTASAVSGKPCDSTASACFVVSAPSFSDCSSTEDSEPLGPKTSNKFTFPPASTTLFESLSSPSTENPTSTDFPIINSPRSDLPVVGLTATTSSLCGEKSSSASSQSQSTVSAPVSATVSAGCSPHVQEVAAILASQCNKFLSGQAPRQAQGKEKTERQGIAPQAKSSSKPFDDEAHAPTAEQNYGESKPCSVPMTGAPSTSTSSVHLGSKSGSLVLFHTQLAEEDQPYLPPVDLLNSTVEMWEKVVANKKTDQEVTDEGLRHFYEGINYFCLQYERLQEATAKYKDVAKASDNLEKMKTSLEDKLVEACRKLEDSEKEKKKLECKLATSENVITALTGDKESLLWVQTLLHQKIFELTTELEKAGTAAIQKYKASSLYKQELMEYAAPYMGEGVKLAIEKIKAKDPTFDPKTYGLELYMLPLEADDAEFSPSDCGADQEHNEVKPSAAALALSDPPVASNNKEPTVLNLSGEEAKDPSSSA